jgi:hypothetical protein
LLSQPPSFCEGSKEWSGELIRPARAARSGWVKSALLSIKRLFFRIFVAFQVFCFFQFQIAFDFRNKIKEQSWCQL